MTSRRPNRGRGGEWTRPTTIRRRRRRAARGRGVALLGLLVCAGVLALVVGLTVGRDDDSAPPLDATVAQQPLTFPEGLRREDMARLLDEKTDLSGEEYLQATAASAKGADLAERTAATSLEGFLFPATYPISPEATVGSLVDQQIAAYRDHVAAVDFRFSKSRNLTPYEVLIIASMVEREVVVRRERSIVAGVMYNRLRRRMRLDIDATVQYAVGEWRELSADDLAIDSPYNTRRYPGLPPGPIASPGIASIQAAARPAVHDYLYYVARNDGTGRHYFARTLEEFEALKVKARQNG